MKQAIMIGAGNIGRGFIGAILSRSGYHVTFADVNMTLIDAINAEGRYTVHIQDRNPAAFTITNIDGISSAGPELAEALKTAELVTTAVGLRILPIVAKPIAAGLAARKNAGNTAPLNIVACENAVRATSQLKNAVYALLDDETKAFADANVGFADCAVDRIVPKMDFAAPLDVAVEEFSEWDVERSGWKGELPQIDGMSVVDDLSAYIERKLFTLNTGHAITAYLGRMKGYMTICQSISDEHIHTIVKAAMRESGRGLVALYGFDRDAHFAYIDKIIGRLYPLFGAVLIIMAVGMTVTMFTNGCEFYNWASFPNNHPQQLPIFPLVFITIACGALSGFHATQSPLMSRCLSNEKQGKAVFYGGMVAEGFIGLVWATVGMTFYTSPEALAAAGGPANVVNETARALMGPVGGVLAILGVVALPVTSGDTAFRAARLTIAEMFNFKQSAILARLAIAIPIFAIGVVLNFVDFNVIWRYFGFANQALAAIMLWASGAYLYRKHRLHWICTVPATFMTAVCISYICYEPKMGFGMGIQIADIIGVIVAVVSLVAFLALARKPIAGAPSIDEV